MLQKQNGVCKICLKPETRAGCCLAVDHDHKTRVVRGLLCGSCNNALGRLKDDPEIAMRAHHYLKGTL
jgi:hypothetical protein